MKYFRLSLRILGLFCSGCFDIAIDVPIGNFQLMKADLNSGFSHSLDKYLKASTEDLCDRSLMAFLLGTTTPNDRLGVLPEKIRRDLVQKSEFAAANDACVDMNATDFLKEKVHFSSSIARSIPIKSNGEEMTDCQKKLNDPEKVKVESIWLTIAQNSLNFDIPPGALYFARDDGALVRFATFEPISKGSNKVIELPIDDDKKDEITTKFMSRNIEFVVRTDNFTLAEVTEAGHSYFQLPNGAIEFKISANVVANVGFFDVKCIRDVPSG